jgi:hypothetical protein
MHLSYFETENQIYFVLKAKVIESQLMFEDGSIAQSLPYLQVTC